MVVLIDQTDDPQITEICGRHGAEPAALLEILHDVQRARGYLSDESLRSIAYELNISRADIHGVVSFYHDYRRSPPARHSVKICRAEACQAVGSEELAAHAEEKLHTKFGAQSVDGEYSLEPVYCLGNCTLGPAAMIDNKLYGRVTSARLDALVEDARAKQECE